MPEVVYNCDIWNLVTSNWNETIFNWDERRTCSQVLTYIIDSAPSRKRKDINRSLENLPIELKNKLISIKIKLNGNEFSKTHKQKKIKISVDDFQFIMKKVIDVDVQIIS